MLFSVPNVLHYSLKTNHLPLSLELLFSVQTQPNLALYTYVYVKKYMNILFVNRKVLCYHQRGNLFLSFSVCLSVSAVFLLAFTLPIDNISSSYFSLPVNICFCLKKSRLIIKINVHE